MILAPSVVVIAEDTGPNHRSPRGQGLDNDKHPSSPGPSTGAVATLRHAPAPAPATARLRRCSGGLVAACHTS